MTALFSIKKGGKKSQNKTRFAVCLSNMLQYFLWIWLKFPFWIVLQFYTGGKTGRYLAPLKARTLGLKRDHWCLEIISGVKTILFLFAAKPRPLALSSMPTAPGWPCHLQRLIGAVRPFTHISFCRICQHSQPFPCTAACNQGWAFPGLIKSKWVFQFRVIERLQHINMLGQHYQPVSLLGVIDDSPSTLTQQTS